VSTVRPGPSPTSRFARASAAVDRTIAEQRGRRPWFDHLARAGGRYRRTQGDLMAAGVTYFAFLGLFPVLLLAVSIVGLVLAGNTLLQESLYDAILEAFPGSTGNQLVTELQGAVDSAGVVGVVGVIGFLYAGLRTMDKLRIGMERIWKGRADEPDFLQDNLQDLVALVLLGAVGLLSLALTGFTTRARAAVLAVLGLEGTPGLSLGTALIGIALAVATDVVVFLWLLRTVPSTSYGLRLLLPGALFGAAGFEGLKLMGSLYLSLISGSVTATAFGGAVGILVWINVVFRFAFFTAAWTATLDSIRAVPAQATTTDGDRRDGPPSGGPPASPPR
jgi:membrane protein